LSLFKKDIKVWIDENGNLIFSKLVIDNIVISKIQCVLQKEGILLIADIMPFKKKTYYCRGYGSMMMYELLKYSYQNQIYTIMGNLSLVDSNHKERLDGFYKKHGFEVIEYAHP